MLDRAGRLKTLVQGTEVSSHLVLGYVPSASSTVLPVLLGRLKVNAPGLHLELREMISSEQIESLVVGHLDAGLMRLRPQHPHLVTAERMADPFCLAMPGSSPPLSPHHRLELRSMAECDFIAFARHRGPAYFDQAIHLCAKAGFSPRIRYEASTVHGVLDLVRGGLGVALAPTSCATMGVQNISFRTLDTIVPGQMLALVRRMSNPHDRWPIVEQTTQAIFADIEQRLRAELNP